MKQLIFYLRDFKILVIVEILKNFLDRILV